jgi:preprotein translocase subunit YajC
MSLLSLLGISSAVAAPVVNTVSDHAPAAAQNSSMSMVVMLVVFIAAFYFLLVRPQQKRAAAQKDLIDNLAVGDEVLTSGGVVGRLTKLRDSFIVLSISKDVEIVIQKAAIASVLPKGTMDTVQ